MMKWIITTTTTAAIIVAAGVSFYPYPFAADGASCCGEGTTGGASQSAERANMSSEEMRDTLMRGIRAMDQLHKFWFQRRLLAALRMERAPPEAALWRTRREQQRRSISSAERTGSGGSGRGSSGNSAEGQSAEVDEQVEETFRRYTLRIIGIPDAQHHRRSHHRRHNNGPSGTAAGVDSRRPLYQDSQCQSDESAPTVHYSFYSKISSSTSASPSSSAATPHEEYETELEKAELELWYPNETLPRLQELRNERGGDENDDQSATANHFFPTAASWQDGGDSAGWSPFRPVRRDHWAGDEQHENRTMFVSDVTDAVRSLWSTTNGANVTISLVRQTGGGGLETTTPCIQSVAPQPEPHHNNHHHHRYQHHARRNHQHSSTTDDESSRPPLVLKLSLKERAIRRVAASRKRSVNSAASFTMRMIYNSSTTKNGRKRQRQSLIEDCESQWDRGFLEQTTTAQYDDLMPCCKRQVHIDFNELGWGSWVIAPQTFHSHYCMGRCTNFGGFASADTEGAAFYTEAMNLYREAKNSGLTPCCSPIKFSPITITVLTGDNEEMTQTLEDVVVRQCGCM